MTFSEALLRVQAGEQVCRAGWKAKPNTKKKSKDQPKDKCLTLLPSDEDPQKPRPRIYVRSLKGDFTPWVPGQADMFAADWDCTA